jgi:hypothetical protein
LERVLFEMGSPYNIPDRTRDDLPGFLYAQGHRTGAEIGVLAGAFTRKLCSAGLRVFAVDPWLAEEHHLERDRNYQKTKNAFYRKAVRNLDGFDCVVVRKTSMDAVVDFEDGSLDFVYIDANHGFRHIAEDLVEWAKKVRPGGVVSGHDYHLSDKCQVAPVVDAYVKAFGIGNWFVLGDMTVEDKDNRLSWMWVK